VAHARLCCWQRRIVTPWRSRSKLGDSQAASRGARRRPSLACASVACDSPAPPAARVVNEQCSLARQRMLPRGCACGSGAFGYDHSLGSGCASVEEVIAGSRLRYGAASRSVRAALTVADSRFSALPGTQRDLAQHVVCECERESPALLGRRFAPSSSISTAEAMPAREQASRGDRAACLHT
jgi:hypothetical protein